jgi:nitrogen fixation/metabolism regulation signal transduction histidine kinase
LKIITRSALKAWWDNRLHEIVNGAASPSGGKLAGKMQEAQLEADQLNMALDLRRDYAGLIRTPRYMDEIDVQSLQRRVKSELASLRGRHVAGQLNIDPPAFHALCLERMDALNSERPQGAEDRSAFLKGCMYDITDRCLHRFTRNAR